MPVKSRRENICIHSGAWVSHPHSISWIWWTFQPRTSDQLSLSILPDVVKVPQSHYNLSYYRVKTYVARKGSATILRFFAAGRQYQYLDRVHHRWQLQPAHPWAGSKPANRYMPHQCLYFNTIDKVLLVMRTSKDTKCMHRNLWRFCYLLAGTDARVADSLCLLSVIHDNISNHRNFVGSIRSRYGLGVLIIRSISSRESAWTVNTYGQTAGEPKKRLLSTLVPAFLL